MELPFVGDTVNGFVSGFLSLFGTLFVLAICVGIVTLVVMYIGDVTQTRHAIRRNYPVVGRFRYFFEHLGEFFRQYFFSMDREELPFNRAERSWVYRAAKHVDTTVAFGSTRDLRPAGTTLFVNCAFPTLGTDAVPPGHLTIGPYARNPFVTASLYNISGMSFGALSAPAVRAPMPLIDEVGLPLRESLPLVVDCLNRHGLRERIRVIASGKLVHPAKIAWALCMGADFFYVSARGYMFALGCIQALQCNRNTCPTGITTHDPKLQRGLDVDNKATRVASFHDQIEYEVGIIAHSCGVREPRQLRRYHCRVVQDDGRSVPLDRLYPDQCPAEPQLGVAGA